MFGIELDTIKKIEIGFCAIILGIAAWLIIRAARGTTDETVQGYSDAEVFVARDARYPVSTTNPLDTNRTYRNTWFINSDGRLQFKEFPRKTTTDRQAEMHFYPDQTKKKYDCFPTVRQTIAEYRDDDKRAVAEAIVQFITVTINNNDRATFTNTSFLRELGMTLPETTKLNEDVKSLIKSIKGIDDDVALGSFEGKKYEQVMASLQSFRDCGPGDISSDPRKSAAAKKVMAVGLEYMKLVQDAKIKEISNFADAILGMLTADQKSKIATLTAPRTPRPTGGGGAGTPARGAGGGAPAGGAAPTGGTRPPGGGGRRTTTAPGI